MKKIRLHYDYDEDTIYSKYIFKTKKLIRKFLFFLF